MRTIRISGNPLITPQMDPSIGSNINGPSLIRTPDWLENPLGRYYLYFAHHKGEFIRLAYSDAVEGPYTVYSPGTLRVEDSWCAHHVASPDVHVDHENRRLIMYYHGPDSSGPQISRVATSTDGLHFEARPQILGREYFRVWKWDGWHYALAMPGVLYRSRDGLSDWETGPRIFHRYRMRHSAVRLRGHTLQVFFSCISDCPERILMTEVDLRPDWAQWSPGPEVEVLAPEEEYEGADLPLEVSVMGWAPQPVRQVRDPAIFTEDGQTWLLFSIAGESGIAMARLED